MADEKYQMLDLPMNEVFDWSEDNIFSYELICLFSV